MSQFRTAARDWGWLAGGRRSEPAANRDLGRWRAELRRQPEPGQPPPGRACSSRGEDPERRSERARQSAGSWSRVHPARRPLAARSRAAPLAEAEARRAPSSGPLGPQASPARSVRLVARPGRRCGGVRRRRPSALERRSSAACGSSSPPPPPPPPPSHPSSGGARPPRRFCTNKGGPRGAGVAPPALGPAPARGGR
ncbi:uncharacterized protein LOC143271186 [Peromyscus maniculatus bairdii]|uniref:uncharacterized protein LOC143271186 n=1 Tax=Peromyscus maniculatus bairdii TaxID=230844 RepID=UPI003FD5D8FA